MSKITQINTYDDVIRHNAENFLPGVDWRLVKAQLIQESRLNPNAVSPAGAQGLAQFMPATWLDMKKQMRMPADASPFSPQYAIPALCFYMSQLNAKWKSPRPDADRYALALASYNAGFGNLTKAQALADDASEYHRIIAELPNVTGAQNAHETSTYVERIFDYFVDQILEG